ncbi:Leucoanthocyanidin dioxygenase-like protein, partial [Thalictrum thalictroides]
MSSLHTWPEPIVRVQSLSESGSTVIPNRYIKPPSERPLLSCYSSLDDGKVVNIPVIDLSGLNGDDENLHAATMNDISKACREWGFFQILNHGVCPDLMRHMRSIWRDFFHLPVELKQEYANSPKTYEGYGSRLGVQKGAVLDWGDYFFLHYCPQSIKNHNKWPAQPYPCRETTEEYGKQLVKLCGNLMKILSKNLGLGVNHLQNLFGGEDI